MHDLFWYSNTKKKIQTNKRKRRGIWWEKESGEDVVNGLNHLIWFSRILLFLLRLFPPFFPPFLFDVAIWLTACDYWRLSASYLLFCFFPFKVKFISTMHIFYFFFIYIPLVFCFRIFYWFISLLKNFKFSFIFFPPTLHIYFLKKGHF